MCCCLYLFSLSNLYAHLFTIELAFDIYWVYWLIFFILYEAKFGSIINYLEDLRKVIKTHYFHVHRTLTDFLIFQLFKTWQKIPIEDINALMSSHQQLQICNFSFLNNLQEKKREKYNIYKNIICCNHRRTKACSKFVRSRLGIVMYAHGFLACIHL